MVLSIIIPVFNEANSGRTYTEGKKIGWHDGVKAIRCIIKYRVKS